MGISFDTANSESDPRIPWRGGEAVDRRAGCFHSNALRLPMGG